MLRAEKRMQISKVLKENLRMLLNSRFPSGLPIHLNIYVNFAFYSYMYVCFNKYSWEWYSPQIIHIKSMLQEDGPYLS